MVGWVFAGGGESEMKALIPFLSKHFSGCTFERKTPYRKKPGPKPGKLKTRPSLGRTGKSLVEQIKFELVIALKSGFPNLILVMDDLDCNDQKMREKLFLDAIKTIPGTEDMVKQVGFAAPEFFSKLAPERNTCEEKLSELIMEASQRDEGKDRFSKGTHTPRMLMNVNPDIVCGKCPHFRNFYLQLMAFCNF